jgi:hypothetical protein
MRNDIIGLVCIVESFLSQLEVWEFWRLSHSLLVKRC